MALAVTVFVGCTGAKKPATEQDGSAVATVENVKEANYFGTYEGVLPCADCGGIKTTLKINEDTTYELRSEYEGRENGVVEESGVYTVLNGEVIELTTPSSGNKTYYKILEEAVALSDAEGTLNDGELAAHYILKKQ